MTKEEMLNSTCKLICPTCGLELHEGHNEESLECSCCDELVPLAFAIMQRVTKK